MAITGPTRNRLMVYKPSVGSNPTRSANAFKLGNLNEKRIIKPVNKYFLFVIFIATLCYKCNEYYIGDYMIEKIKLKAKQLKKQVVIVYLAYIHKDVEWYKKAFLLLILLYALSPIDLIPDFIPILGILDDIILIPLGITIAIKIIPKNVWEECKIEAESDINIDSKYKKLGAAFIALIWVIVLILLIKGLK